MKQLRCQLRDSVPPVELSLTAGTRHRREAARVYRTKPQPDCTLAATPRAQGGPRQTRTPRPRAAHATPRRNLRMGRMAHARFEPRSRRRLRCRRSATRATASLRSACVAACAAPGCSQQCARDRLAPRGAWRATRTPVDGCSPPREVRLGLLVMADAAAEQTPEQVLQAKLTERLQAQFVSAADLSDGCGSKFQCVIISALFEGKPLLVRNTPRLTSPTHILKSGGLLGSGTPSAGQRSPQGGDGGAHAPRRVSSAMALCCAST